LSNNKLKLAYVDSFGSYHVNKMQSMSSKWHHFTMHNLNARVRVTVYF